MAKFGSWDSYSRFRFEIARKRRYVRTPEADEFLRVVAATCKTRLRPMAKGMLLWRAQLWVDQEDHWRLIDDEHDEKIPAPLPPKRMKPRKDRASEGRVNPKGIPCLYLSTTQDAAMSEVRPWIGSLVSVARFKTNRHLVTVDCSVAHDQYINLLLDRKWGEPISEEKVDEIVWAAIDQAFSEPVTPSDDVADYAATQSIAELFRSEGYDGVAYKSVFGQAYTVALFDLQSVTQLDGALFKTIDVKFAFSEEDRYFLRAGSEDRT